MTSSTINLRDIKEKPNGRQDEVLAEKLSHNLKPRQATVALLCVIVRLHLAIIYLDLNATNKLNHFPTLIIDKSSLAVDRT